MKYMAAEQSAFLHVLLVYRGMIMASTMFLREKELEIIKLLVIHKGDFQEYEIKDSISIGRASSVGNCDVAVASPIVSRNHGEIIKKDGFFFYKDLNSTNGTYINGKLYGRESADKISISVLQAGDVLRIDHADLFHAHEEAVLFLIMHQEDTKKIRKSITIKDNDEVIIGRTSDGVSLKDKSVSERHASVCRQGERWIIKDLDSKNGIFVNGNKIDKEQILYSMDVFRISDYLFLIYEDQLIYYCEEQMANRLVIHIKERNARQLFKKYILLKDINLSVNQNEMVMILGGSGAGKTTFINAVMGYEKAEGEIKHNEVDIYKNYEKVKRDIGFVPQQDLLRLEDSVYKTLENAADYKLGKKITNREKEERIDKVLSNLGLSREKHSTVKKLSGGQRKRLSIAVELIADPSLFFLDEPDSGLDGIMARSLMEQLRCIADEGKIVMVITHAPDRVRDLFDKVIILAKSEKDNIGKMAFYGKINEAFDFFETDSLEGVVKKINRVDEGGDGLSDFYIEKYRNYGGK